MSKRILIITGDGGESFETWFALQRFPGSRLRRAVAAPSKRRLHLVMHDFEPGWDTYKESPGYAIDADLTFDEVVVDDYEAVLCIGGRAPEYLRNDKRVSSSCALRRAWPLALLDLPWHPADRGGRSAGGKRFTCYEHVRFEVEACGGRDQSSDVVRDGRLVSSPTWREHPAFSRQIYACLQQPVAV